MLLLSILPLGIACSSSKSTGTTASKSIDATGGSLASMDGALTLDVPAGALGSATTVTITPATGAPTGSVGLVFDIGPNGTQFAKPVKLTFKIPQGQVSASGLVVATATGGTWQPVSGSVADVSAGTVSGLTTHLSIWGCIVGAGFTPVSQGCQDCGGTACAAQVDACNQDNICSSCIADYKQSLCSTSTTWQALLSCGCSSCASTCTAECANQSGGSDGGTDAGVDAGATGPVSAACQSCVAGSSSSPCKSQANACFGDTTCKACVQIDRNGSGCASNSLFSALNSCACSSTCAAVECKTDCS